MEYLPHLPPHVFDAVLNFIDGDHYGEMANAAQGMSDECKIALSNLFRELGMNALSDLILE